MLAARAFTALTAAALTGFATAQPGLAHACVPLAAWVVPAGTNVSGTPPRSGVKPIGARELFARLRAAPVVLLGEAHDNAEHHRWQLHTLAALHAQRPDIVLGFEMFPRSVQEALDRWVGGELSEAEFLERARWSEVWGFDAAHYLPLFHFARMHRLPMVALNVERSLVRRIGREGPEAVPAHEREGVGLPAPATAEYLRSLHTIYLQHGEGRSVDMNDAAFQRFVASQLMWDRAMAEGIGQARARYPERQVVAIMGRGHTVPGAVPHQLRALGIAPTSVLLPWDRVSGCKVPEPGSADAVFGLGSPPDSGTGARPRLGAMLAAGDGPGARIERVEPGSVADEAGLRAGDVVVALAGREVRRNADVLNAIGRQAPGTWLPLTILRDGAELELVAKFPPR